MVQVYRLVIDQVWGQDYWVMDKDIVKVHKHNRNENTNIQPPNKPSQ